MIRFPSLLIVALCISCDKKESPKTEATAAVSAAITEASESVAAAPAASAAVPDPCAVLTEAMVRKHLSVPEDVKVDQRLSKHSRHPHCAYDWDTLSGEERQAQNAEMVQKMMAGMKKGKLAQGVLEAASANKEGAHLTISHKRFATDEATRSALASARKMLDEGIKREVRGHEVEIKAKTETVEGIGSAAYWDGKQSQLSIAAKRYVIHVGASAKHKPTSLEVAKALTADVIANL